SGQEPVNSSRNVRECQVSAKTTPDRCATQHDGPEPRQACHEEHDAPSGKDQERLTEVRPRCKTRQSESQGGHSEAVTRNVRTTTLRRKKPGAKTPGAGLPVLGRLHRNPQDMDPSARSLDLNPEKQRCDCQNQRAN